jgi:hypothetical protein
MFCKGCGQPITDEARFCSHCGNANQAHRRNRKLSFWNKLFGGRKEPAPAAPMAPPQSSPPRKTVVPISAGDDLIDAVLRADAARAAREKLDKSTIMTPPKDEQLKCDVCSSAVWRTEGYALTTAQVTTDSRYWRYIFKQVQDDPLQSSFLAMTMPGKQAAQTSPWLVCESCSHMFDFDRSVARDCAVRNAAPPNSGPANEDAVMGAAVKAMMRR